MNPAPSTWEALFRRPLADDPVVTERVQAILIRVKEGGDEALRALSREIDGRSLEALEIPADVIREAAARHARPLSVMPGPEIQVRWKPETHLDRPF